MCQMYNDQELHHTQDYEIRVIIQAVWHSCHSIGEGNA